MIKYSFHFLGFWISILCLSCSKNLIPERPQMANTEFSLDSIPESEINIPIQINLKPVYALMENKIDQLYTSPNWPDDWVQEDCTTRYKYSFRRSPLQLIATGKTLDLSFIGYYQLIGSTRICVGDWFVSPWTPECKCGFQEAERRVLVKFTNIVSISPDLKIKISINTLDPQPIDQCKVCFWDQDITKLVMKGLKEELDLAKSEIEKSISEIDLRPYLQNMWNELNTNYNLYNLGWLNVNPSQIKITDFYAQNDSLNISIGLTAKPVISLEKQQKALSSVPDFSNYPFKKGFNINLDANLNYDSLSWIITERIRNKRFDFSKGPIKKNIILNMISIFGIDNEKIVLKVNFSGSNSGEFYLTGKPVYDINSKRLELKDLDFDIRTKAVLVKTASWMLNRKILYEIERYSKIDLAGYIDSAKSKIHSMLNTQLIPGIESLCSMDTIEISSIKPMRNYLFIRSKFSGNLSLKVSTLNLKL